jgi:hypothetical protein
MIQSLIICHSVRYLREAFNMALDVLLAEGVDGIIEELDED